jgi:hypothetical protein
MDLYRDIIEPIWKTVACFTVTAVFAFLFGYVGAHAANSIAGFFAGNVIGWLFSVPVCVMILES